MSAPTLTVQQKFRTVRNKSKQGSATKTVLYSPCVATWPAVDKTAVKEILAELDRAFEGMDFRRSITQIDKSLKKREKTKSKENRRLENLKRKKVLDEWRKQCLTEEQISLRKQLTVGVQEVTKQLEKDALRLVLVDREKETLIHQHLVSLSAVKKCPAAALRGLSTAMCPKLAVNSLVAIGFKKRLGDDSDKFDNAISFISERLSPIDCAFLNFPKPELPDTGKSTQPLKKTDLNLSSHDIKKEMSSSCSVHSSASDNKNVKTESKLTLNLVQKSLYVYKSTGFDGFISLGHDEIEDVTSDQEEHSDNDSFQTSKNDASAKKNRKRKQKQKDKHFQKNKKQKQSGFSPAKVGLVKSNVNRKKK